MFAVSNLLWVSMEGGIHVKEGGGVGHDEKKLGAVEGVDQEAVMHTGSHLLKTSLFLPAPWP